MAELAEELQIVSHLYALVTQLHLGHLRMPLGTHIKSESHARTVAPEFQVLVRMAHTHAGIEGKYYNVCANHFSRVLCMFSSGQQLGMYPSFVVLQPLAHHSGETE